MRYPSELSHQAWPPVGVVPLVEHVSQERARKLQGVHIFLMYRWSVIPFIAKLISGIKQLGVIRMQRLQTTPIRRW
jgi:hypothetical protein